MAVVSACRVCSSIRNSFAAMASVPFAVSRLDSVAVSRGDAMLMQVVDLTGYPIELSSIGRLPGAATAWGRVAVIGAMRPRPVC
jgi:hypothetical protein